MNIDFPDEPHKLAGRVRVILVGPKYEGNIGAVARSMKNTGLSDLAMVQPPEIGDEAIARAMGGRSILAARQVYPTLEAAAEGFAIIAGTSSVATSSRKKFRRIPVTPEAFWNEFSQRPDRIAIVLGREDDGLRNEELELCNYFINIPASPDYPVYNLSHAAAIIFYEMFKHAGAESNDSGKDPILPENYAMLMDRLSDLLDEVSYPKSKRRNIDTMLRRITARASLSETEYYKLMGIIRIVRKHLDKDE
ncbi:tRNA (cytidine/uridine-2'-O-)-methyltransferase TrmJ [Thermoplasmatales archaeon]|nr:tRNA (cytidine/uridine-2'-O-)-methyltransferase TrmJ [Thermoplasmatales archaeon]